MAKYTYRVHGNSKWMGLSGNALFAIANKAGSGKKISISSLEIHNNTRVGKVTTIDTNTPPPVRLKVAKVSDVSGGNSINSIAVPSNSADGVLDSGIRCLSDCGFTKSTINYFDTATFTQAGAAIGNTTFTPDSAPGWIGAQIADGDFVFNVASGSNAGNYLVISNSTTALVFTPAFPATASTTATLQETDTLYQFSVNKLANAAVSISPQTSAGFMNGKSSPTGGAFVSNTNANTQAVYVSPTEKLAVFSDNPHANLPMQVTVTLTVLGTPNKTYTLCYFITLFSDTQAVFGIDNTSSSEVVINSITVDELGTVDTPYFQYVPILAIDPASLADAGSIVTAVPFDSTSPDIATSADIVVNAPVLPSGVPVSYLADASAGSPKGFNYLNTKDFIGPAYMTFFPEAAAHKTSLGSYWTNTVPGTFGSHLSSELASVKGASAPIILREGEAVAVVSGAETATGTVAVGISGWGSYDFSFTLVVENATDPMFALSGLQPGSTVNIYRMSDSVKLAGVQSSGTDFSYVYDYAGDVLVRVSIQHFNYEYLEFNYVLGSGQVTLPITQRFDRVAINPA